MALQRNPAYRAHGSKRRKPNVQIAPKLKCPSESSHLSELRPSVVRCIIEHVGEHYVTLGPYFPCDRRDSGCPWFWRNRRSEEHTSELQSLMRISYAVFCLKKKTTLPRYTQFHI